MIRSMLHARAAVVDARLNAATHGARAAELGLTLIETLLAIGVGALIIVAAVAFYMNAAASSRVNEHQSQIQGIISGMHSLSASQTTYTNISMKTAILGHVFSPEMVADPTGASTSVYNPWRGLVVVSGAAGTTFTITTSTLPGDACIQMASNVTSYGSGITTLTVNGSALALPVTPDAATGACNSTDTNSIVYTVR